MNLVSEIAVSKSDGIEPYTCTPTLHRALPLVDRHI